MLTFNNEVSEWCLINGDLELLGVDVHFEQGVTEDMSKAAGVEVAVGSAVVLVVVDLRELKAAVLQQLIVVELLVGHVNLVGHRQSEDSALIETYIYYNIFLAKKNGLTLHANPTCFTVHHQELKSLLHPSLKPVNGFLHPPT